MGPSIFPVHRKKFGGRTLVDSLDNFLKKIEKSREIISSGFSTLSTY